MEGMTTQRMYVSRLAGCSGPSPSVLLLYIFLFFALKTDQFLDFMLSPKSQSHLCSSPVPYLSRNHVPVNQISLFFENGAVKSRGTA